EKRARGARRGPGGGRFREREARRRGCGGHPASALGRLARGMSDQGVADEWSRDQIAALEAFEAKFKPDDFTWVAHALRLPEEPETLSWLREMLLPEFRFFVESCSGRKVSREEKIDRLGKLRNAAATLDILLGPGGTRSGLPRRLWGSNL